jgi:hypothetical protein
MGHAACTNCDVRILRYHLSAWIMGLVEGRHFKLIELCRQTEFLILRFQGYFSGRKWKFPLSAGSKTKTRTKLFWNSVVNKFKPQISKIFILLRYITYELFTVSVIFSPQTCVAILIVSSKLNNYFSISASPSPPLSQQHISTIPFPVYFIHL